MRSAAAAPALLLLAACASEPSAGGTRTVDVPFPGMTPAQVEAMDACLTAFGRQRQPGPEARASARARCAAEAWRLEEWWPRYVKGWDAATN